MFLDSVNQHFWVLTTWSTFEFIYLERVSASYTLTLIAWCQGNNIVIAPNFETINNHNILWLCRQRNQKSNCQHLLDHQKGKRVPEKTSISALLAMPKALTVWTTTNSGKFWKRWEYQTTWPASWEICMQVSKQQLEMDMEQQTGSKLGKEYI